MKFDGVYVACITPFSKEGKVQLDLFEKHLHFLSSKGVDGFVVCATTGEGPVLIDDEKAVLLKIARKVADQDGKKVIAGCSSNSTEEVEEQLYQAMEMGADAGLVVTPYYNKPTQRGVLAHFEKIANREILPIILYNNPGRTMINLVPESLQSLLKHPMILGVKESSGNYSQWLSISNLPEIREKYWLAGDDDSFALTLLLGGKGIIATAANICPEPFVDMYRAALEKNWEKAFDIQKHILPFVKSLFLETNPAPLKYALRKFKQYDAFVRLPLVEVEPSTQSQIDKAWAEVFDA